MGSKTKILNFVVDGINLVHQKNRPVLDLFAGSASLAGGIGKQGDFISNDIQEYSKILSQTYLSELTSNSMPDISEIYEKALRLVKENTNIEHVVDYSTISDVNIFNTLEEKQKKLIELNFDYTHHLFTKYYSEHGGRMNSAFGLMH